MIKARITQPDIEEIRNLLGIPGTVPDTALSEKIQKCSEQALRTARPKLVYRILEITFCKDAVRLQGTNTVLTGLDIRKHLSGCSKAALLALTLGTEPERLLMRSEPADALILDACFSVLAEQACDHFETDLRKKLSETGLYLTGRFSPGYGDLPLSLQGEFLNILNAERTAGLTVTDSGILVPRKSVTAVLGVSGQPVTGHLAGCENCTISDRCEYRREGKACEGK